MGTTASTRVSGSSSWSTGHTRRVARRCRGTALLKPLEQPAERGGQARVLLDERPARRGVAVRVPRRRYGRRGPRRSISSWPALVGYGNGAESAVPSPHGPLLEPSALHHLHRRRPRNDPPLPEQRRADGTGPRDRTRGRAPEDRAPRSTSSAGPPHLLAACRVAGGGVRLRARRRGGRLGRRFSPPDGGGRSRRVPVGDGHVPHVPQQRRARGHAPRRRRSQQAGQSHPLPARGSLPHADRRSEGRSGQDRGRAEVQRPAAPSAFLRARMRVLGRRRQRAAAR